MTQGHSMFEHAPDIHPQFLTRQMTISDLLRALGQTCFEARNVFQGASLFQRMIVANDTIWLGIAGAGIAGGMGGMKRRCAFKGAPSVGIVYFLYIQVGTGCRRRSMWWAGGKAGQVK